MSQARIQELARLYKTQHGVMPSATYLADRTGSTIDQVRAALGLASQAVTNEPSIIFRPPEKPLPRPARAPKTVQEREQVPKMKPSATKPDKSSFWGRIRAFRLPSMESIVLKFAHSLQYFGFMVAGVMDVGIGVLFYWSLGSDTLSKTIFAGFGLIQTTGKVWGWSYSKVLKPAIAVAIVASILSIFSATSIFRAEIELQAQSAILENTATTAKVNQKSAVDVIQGQITRQEETVKKAETARDKWDPAIEEQLPMYRTNKRLADEENAKLTKLLGDLEKAKEAERKAEESARVAATEKVDTKPVPAASKLQLDAWAIFRQWTVWDDTDPNYKSRVLSFWYALAFSLLLELIIFATTPRKQKLEGEAGK